MAQQHFCTNCEVEVNDFIIECGECNQFLLCLDCFSCGAELGNHKRTHKYRLKQITSLFGDNDGWSTKDDLKLLYALLEFGPRWDKVAEKLKRPYDEVKDHYVKRFIESDFAKYMKSDQGVPLLEEYEPSEDDPCVDQSSAAFDMDGNERKPTAEGEKTNIILLKNDEADLSD